MIFTILFPLGQTRIFPICRLWRGYVDIFCLLTTILSDYNILKINDKRTNKNEKIIGYIVTLGIFVLIGYAAGTNLLK